MITFAKSAASETSKIMIYHRVCKSALVWQGLKWGVGVECFENIPFCILSVYKNSDKNDVGFCYGQMLMDVTWHTLKQNTKFYTYPHS